MVWPSEPPGRLPVVLERSKNNLIILKEILTRCAMNDGLADAIPIPFDVLRSVNSTSNLMEDIKCNRILVTKAPTFNSLKTFPRVTSEMTGTNAPNGRTVHTNIVTPRAITVMREHSGAAIEKCINTHKFHDRTRLPEKVTVGVLLTAIKTGQQHQDPGRKKHRLQPRSQGEHSHRYPKNRNTT